MREPWLSVIGIGEDGLAGLNAEARALIDAAQVIIGGERHLELSGNESARRISWPSPFSTIIDEIKALKGQAVVVLVTGDPLWYSAGSLISRAFSLDEMRIVPHLSGYQLAASRMAWPLPDVELLTVHGRPVEQIAASLYPDAKLLLLTANENSPGEIAELLCAHGYGSSHMVALCAVGGPRESRHEAKASEWAHQVDAFHVLAIKCVADEGAQPFSKTGLPDDAFSHDGNITKQVVRAATLSKLVPQRGGLLWDIGAGCGSVGIEWMRAAPGAIAIGIEPRADRRELAMQNAKRLGTPTLKLVEGKAPQALEGLAEPDAVFIGGGIGNAGVFDFCWQALIPGGRLVANVVTLQGEQAVAALQQSHGGELVRIAVSTCAPVGALAGFKPAMAVSQWSITKPRIMKEAQ